MNAILKYPGAKWRIANWIIEHFPPHKVYVEPFFGSGAVFFRKQPAYIETINDRDGNIVNLFRVCRERPQELAALIELTPFARDEFQYCYEPSNDPVEQARRTLVRYHQSFGTSNSSKNSWRNVQTYTVSIEVSQLDDYMRAKLFGHRRDASGGIVISENDKPPELALMFRTALSDKQNYKYTVLYKGRFKPNEETSETKKKDSITYGVEGAIEGNFYCRTSDGTAKYSLRSDNATTAGKTKIAEWFTDVQNPDKEDFTETEAAG